MMHKDWSSIKEVPFSFSKSSIKCHTGQKNRKFRLTWGRLLSRSQLSNPSDLLVLLQTTSSYVAERHKEQIFNIDCDFGGWINLNWCPVAYEQNWVDRFMRTWDLSQINYSKTWCIYGYYQTLQVCSQLAMVYWCWPVLSVPKTG